MNMSFFFFFRLSHQGSPHLILHILRSNTFTPTSCISSFTTSKYLLFGLSRFFFLTTASQLLSAAIVLSRRFTRPYHLCLDCLTFCPSLSTVNENVMLFINVITNYSIPLFVKKKEKKNKMLVPVIHVGPTQLLVSTRSAATCGSLSSNPAGRLTFALCNPAGRMTFVLSTSYITPIIRAEHFIVYAVRCVFTALLFFR